jgi:hypothetical protein
MRQLCRALMLLAVFRGGFTRDAAYAIAGVPAALLSGLRVKSLLRPAGARRHDMHAVVQQFAAQALTADPQTAERAHRLWLQDAPDRRRPLTASAD